MKNPRACPHCKSPSRLNPCWWFINHPELSTAGADPPCCDDFDQEDWKKRQRKARRARRIALIMVIIIGAAIVYWTWRP